MPRIWAASVESFYSQTNISAPPEYTALISILILTKNEEVNIARCIASVRWSNEIVVFDSFSTDRTVELATAAGARVIQHPFIDYGSQREAARQVEYRNPWVLAIDADEQPDAEARGRDAAYGRSQSHRRRVSDAPQRLLSRPLD